MSKKFNSMKNLLKILIVALTLSFVFYSCTTTIPISKQEPDNNPTYEVYYLFEHEGCKVYRFRDAGNYVYFTNCKGSTTSVINDSTRVQTIYNPDLIESREKK